MGRSNRSIVPIITDPRTILTFGKYRGETIREVLDNDPQYLVWLHENSEHFELGWELLEEASKPPQHTFSGFSTRYDPR